MNAEKDNDFSFWDEFDWEESFRETDHYAARYFQLLKRFSDLPDMEKLIASNLRREFPNDENSVLENMLLEIDSPYEEADDDHDENLEEDENVDENSEDDEAELQSFEEAFEEAAGADFSPEAFFPENHPAYKALRQVALSWTNIHAAILPDQARKAGIRITFSLGRALATLGYSVDQSLPEQQAARIAFAKRTLKHINAVCGMMHDLRDTSNANIPDLLDAMQQHLLEAREKVINHLLKSRTNGGAEDDEDEEV